MNSHIKVVDKLLKFVKLNKENQRIEQLYTSKEKGNNILSYADLLKLCHIITYFPELNQKLGKKKLLFLYTQIQDTLNGGINIVINYNPMWIKLI